MKKYNKILPIALVFLMCIAIYNFTTTSTELKNTYDTNLTLARENAEKGLTDYALPYYYNSLDILETVDLYLEIAHMYKDVNVEEYIVWLENTIDKYPTDIQAYEELLEYYYSLNDYSNCFHVVDRLDYRGLNSETTQKIVSDIEYEYYLSNNTYDEVVQFCNGSFPVRNGTSWGFVSLGDSNFISMIYKEVAPFSVDSFAAVVDNDNNAYFINSYGKKAKIADEEYASFGVLSNGLVSALMSNGKYTFLNSELEKAFGEYDQVTEFNYEVALVKIKDKWSLINTSGEKVSETSFDDVVINENLFAINNERFFAKTDGSYYMFNTNGEKVNDNKYENANTFEGGNYATVQIDGEWQFVDIDGKIVEHKYSEAKSFSNGYAAVRINDKWGFVNQEFEMVVEPNYDDVKYFTSIGSNFVKIGEKWQMLKFYKYF